MIAPWEWIALGASLSLLVLSCGLAVKTLMPARRSKPSIEWPLSWHDYAHEHGIPAVVHTKRIELPTGHFEPILETGPIVVIGPQRKPRHNLHCSKCGRFARAVEGMPGVTHCLHHGMTTRLVFIPDTVEEMDLVYPSIESKLILSGHTN